MLALQFDVRCVKRIRDQLYIYRYENRHPVLNENEAIVFNESGILNPELYCRKSNLVRSAETNDLQFKLHRKECIICANENPRVKFRRSIRLDGYCVSAFFSLLRMSHVYRSHVLNFHYEVLPKIPVRSGLTEVIIYQELPKKHLLDYAGSKIFEFLIYQRIELEHAMAWLSTLGGGFSALGDNQIHCAVVAGHISVQQFRIAMELGDEMTVMRCILYYSLSLVQRGYLKQARKIIEHQYSMAKMMPCIDSRILSMCCGIWARLKYEYEKKKQKKIHCKVR